MSFFFEQLARGAGLIEGLRADTVPAGSFEITEEVEISPAAVASQPPAQPLPILSPPLSAVAETIEPADPPRPDLKPAPLRYETIEVAGPSPMTNRPAAPAEQSQPDLPAPPPAEIVMDHVFRWIARAEPRAPALVNDIASPPASEPARPLPILSTPVPSDKPPALRDEPDEPIPTFTIYQESTAPLVIPQRPPEPSRPARAAAEEHVELNIGSIHVVVEAAPPAGRPTTSFSGPRKRNAASAPVPLPPPSLRRYGLLPD